MHKIFIVIGALFINLFAMEDLEPSKIFKASGTVQSIVYKNNNLYAGTSEGKIEVFDTFTAEKIKEINIPEIKDFMGDIIPAKIYSIDLIDNKLLIVSQGMKGYRNIFIYENENLKKVIDIDKKYFIQKANFISKDKIVFALLSNQIGIYDLKKEKLDYLIQVSASSFSDFSLSEDKKVLVTTDESGIVRKIKVENAQIFGENKNKNLDKVYQIDYKNGVILTAGQDRQAVIYKDFADYSMRFDFLLYSCGLSPKAKLGGIAYNEKNEVLIFDVNTKEKLYNLKGQKATLTQILFKNKDEVFVSSDDSSINYFKLK
ncbi:WD40 repeat domain-containing protein [Arcobacter arenosus]|uniref:WD40 repeat domain-containing protein n=1 Tax=Arcobacter arenosus TaxID=2576037 RepID=UPI003BABD838